MSYRVFFFVLCCVGECFCVFVFFFGGGFKGLIGVFIGV